MKIDGLVSGLQTAEVIDALMKVHAIPQSLLTAKIADRNSMVTNLQSLNTGLQQLFEKAKTAASAGSLAVYAATASHASVTVVAGSTASALSTDIVVDAVASAHTVVTAAATSANAWGGVFTVVAADGTRTELTSVGGSAQDLAKAINLSNSSVTATVIPAGTDAGGAPLSRIQLTADETGAAAAFTLFRGTATEVDAGTATDISTEAGAAVITEGADARIRLYAGSAAEQVLTSGTNTFTLADGIDVTVSQAGSDPVRISVVRDSAAQTAAAEAFVKEIAGLLTRIDNGSKATIADRGETTTLGVFTGDSTVRSLRTALAAAVQAPVGGVSPSAIGISFDEKGVLSFNAEKFAQALADDPEATQTMFADISGRVQATTAQYSDRYDGLLTQRITGQESEVKTLRDQVERWDLRLDQRRATLERTYARLEVQLSTLQSQSSWLSSQLAGLNPASSSSS
jgi:flagellar hook-associated protein 2